MGCGLFVVLGKEAHRFVVPNIKELGGTVIAHNRERGPVRRKCQVANTLGWSRVRWVQLLACRQQGNCTPQRLICFEGWVETIRFDSQKRGLSSPIQAIGENFGRACRETGGEVLERFFLLPAKLIQCEECDQKKADNARSDEPPG